MAKSRESGCIFNVRKISLKKETVSSVPPQKEEETVFNALDMIQELLIILENTIRSNKKIKTDFDTLLKRKFVEKADVYDFLDPFAAEFQYTRGKATFIGDTDYLQLAKAVVDSVKELAGELGITNTFADGLVNWRERYSAEIVKFGFDL